MKKTLLSVTVLMLVCILALSFAACAKDENMLVVGYTEYEPMNYYDAKGEFVGFDTEFASAVAEKLGLKIKFQLINWNNKYFELSSGSVDCLWNGFTANCADSDGIQRADKVDFSYSYMGNAQCIVVKTGRLSEFTSEAALSGKTCAVEAGSAGDSFVSALSNVDKIDKTAQTDCLTEVKSGAVDFAVIDVLLADSVVGKGNFSDMSKASSIVIANEEYAVGFLKGSSLTAKVNRAIAELSKDGTLLAIAKKYSLENKLIANIGE